MRRAPPQLEAFLPQLEAVEAQGSVVFVNSVIFDGRVEEMERRFFAEPEKIVRVVGDEQAGIEKPGFFDQLFSHEEV